ncbi:hypothetical protein [Paraburkholderia sp. BCC1884]|uniref:hypothetical protein n=1 Tax=Paraburkholderia sp. BCC1884 TaxID=2562668 RepID=UPI001642700A|nr:hypothetical protein [Paraburkholderia sp. BCC1884]
MKAFPLVPDRRAIAFFAGSVGAAVRIQMDTSFKADLIQNIQYDSGDQRVPEPILQTN